MPLIYQSIEIDISEHSSPSSNSQSCRPNRSPHSSGQDRRLIKRPTSDLVVRLSTSASVRRLIRNIHVFGRVQINANKLRLLYGSLLEIDYLVSFSWDVDVSLPSTLLEVLGQHWPNNQLHLRTDLAKGDIRKSGKVLDIAPHMLRSLHVCMPNQLSRSDGEKLRDAKEKLFWVLRHSPGLESLSTYAHGGYMNVRPNPRQQPWHDVKLKYPLPQILELSIADPTFQVADLQNWGENGGWTKLKKITVWDEHLLEAIHGCEQSLRSIHLLEASYGYETALGDLCLSTIGLTELRVKTDACRLPLSALKNCGPSLTTLAIHTHPYLADPWMSMKDIPLDFLQAVHRLCPKLTKLATNLRSPFDSAVSFHPPYSNWPYLNDSGDRIISPL